MKEITLKSTHAWVEELASQFTCLEHLVDLIRKKNIELEQRIRELEKKHQRIG